jgi:hypothetical protein
MNVVVRDETFARETRLRLWAEHLECDSADLARDATQIIDTRWRPVTEEQLRRQRVGLSLTHKPLLLPHVSRRAAGMVGPLNGFLVDG